MVKFNLKKNKTMRIINEKTVITRKKHRCDACLMAFEKGTKMRTQTNDHENQLNTWRTCPTCTELLSKHRTYFADEYNICMNGCVNDSLETGETPEIMLDRFNNQKK